MSSTTDKPTSETSTRYNPKEVEKSIYEFWEKSDYFKAQDKSTKPPYCTVLPPPNVTGSLHLGHALNHTIQDTLIRWKRMKGFNALWLPGTDHAGIATQMVVERELKKEKLNRKQMGREKFLERVWEWKKYSANRIIDQMKALGDSCDWSRHTFTLDEGVSKAVKHVFVDLYKKGLIYQGTRLVNWDTQIESAVSDLEVESKQEKSSLWHIKYQIENSTETLTIATTRPETLLGDTAVCVHPKDSRYRHLIGKKVVLPLVNRTIPVIEDEYVDMTFGSGVVKITPAHDFNDYQIGLRHKLEMINILNPNGTLNENAKSYQSLTVAQARAKVIEDLNSLGSIVKEETHLNTVPVSERSGVVIEPFLSQQWYVAIEKLATPARHAVENGTTSFVPEMWTKTYLHWMNNIQDWCISRQLWWGHRIPAWKCADCEHMTVSENAVTECEKCKSKKVAQVDDVLDTWFSSALWPFSTLGWRAEGPGTETTEALKTFYPNNILVTGFDIIFFWVARMMMMGLHFKQDVPFREVYIHGIIRDAQGRKMSKSLGNTLDPMDLIEKNGADSLRFTLLSQIGSGKDLKFSEQRLEGYRNFMNKIWNASRFSLSALDGFDTEKITSKSVPSKSDVSLPDQWILHKLFEAERDVNAHLENYRFSEAANHLYSFVWNDFCDWYLEFIKPIIYAKTNSAEKSATQLVLAQVMNRMMRLLHPFIPFITEEIYQKLPIKSQACIVDEYPNIKSDEELLALGSKEIARNLDLVREVVSAVRNVRGENRISPSLEIRVKLVPSDEITQKILGVNREFILRLARLSDCTIESQTDLSKCAVVPVMLENLKVDVVIPLEGLVDFAEEVKRIEKSIEKHAKDIQLLSGKLNNENFVKNAPADVIAADKEKLAQIQAQVKVLQDNLVRLK
jgi:valyl-tRNA synthetase